MAVLPVIALAVAAPIAAAVGDGRLLIVFAASAADSALAEQRRRAAAARAEFAARDLRVIEVVGPHVTGAADTAAALRRHFNVPATAFHVVLVGKDGGIKRSAASPLPTASLLATIDAMPMRRDEMRRGDPR